jgi:ribosomal subunit interface protein
MQTPLQITFRDIEHSDPVEQYVRHRAAKLDVLDHRVTSCRVAVEIPHRHARHGQHFRVRIDITVPGGEIVVGHAPGDKRVYEDLYAAIDAAFDDAKRRLHDFVLRRRGAMKVHASQ